MDENQTFSDPADYIKSVEKFPERVDLNKSLDSVEYYHKTLFEVGGFIFSILWFAVAEILTTKYAHV